MPRASRGANRTGQKSGKISSALASGPCKAFCDRAGAGGCTAVGRVLSGGEGALPEPPEGILAGPLQKPLSAAPGIS